MLINRRFDDNSSLSSVLGISFFSTDDPDTCMATMPVDDHTCHPYGALSGGASVALAETLAGAASCELCPGCECLGIEISASHMHAAYKGDTVTATARIIHRGKSLHRWDVRVTNSEGTLISVVRVTNYITNSGKAWPGLNH